MERSGFEALAYSARDGYGQWSGSDGARSLRTGSLTARLGTDESTPLGEAYYYDFRHRLVQSVASNHLGGVSRYSYRYDFTGNPLGVREEHSPGAGSAPDVLVTAFAYDRDRQKALDAGASEYLSKPLNGERLRQTLRELLSEE